MKRTNLICLAAFALAATVLALRLLLFVRMTKTDTPANPSAPAYAAVPSLTASTPEATLFPGLNEQSVTSITVSTPDRSFQFHLSEHGAVSVNGHQADRDIFSVLLNQISGLPVQHHSAFAPQTQDLLLTLVVSTDTHQKTARFYEGSGQGETARIVLDTAESCEYLKTNTWRVGTLMMTCEGTRILDAHGNEQPAIYEETVSIN